MLSEPRALGVFLGTWLMLSSNRPLHGYNGPLGERSEIILD